jgi:cyclopropane fatty-acyl-phospholipid synthase-like methyltransferase
MGSSVMTPYSKEDIFFEPYINFVKGRTRELNLVLDHKGKGRLLDIGCAWGGFLYLAKGSGFEVYGTEISKPNALFAKKELGIPVFDGQLERARYEGEYFDVVVAIHAFEHLPQPRSSAKEIYRILKQTGIFMCIVPNFDSYLSRKTGLHWKWLTPEDHYSHFTPVVLRNLLRQEGFQILRLFSEEGHYGMDEIKRYLSDNQIQEMYNNLQGDEIIIIAEKMD